MDCYATVRNVLSDNSKQELRMYFKYILVLIAYWITHPPTQAYLVPIAPHNCPGT